MVYEEIKFEELDPHENHEIYENHGSNEYEELELQEHDLQEHELQEYELQEYDADNLQECEIQHELQRELQENEEDSLQSELRELAADDLQYYDDEFQPETVEYVHIHETGEQEQTTNDDEWIPQESYEIITTKNHKEEELDDEFPELQFSEFQVNVVDYDEDKPTTTETGRPAHAEGLLTPRRPALQTRTGGAGLQKPVLQHWESRELLENPFERELRLAREFVRARELPALKPASPAPPAHDDAHAEASDSEMELDLDDLEGLQMESFIIVEYPCEEDLKESNFNFDETFTSKSAKYSVYYH